MVRIPSRKIISFFGAVIVIYTVLRFFTARQSPSINNALHAEAVIPIDDEVTSAPSPLEAILVTRQCPLCFGTNLCSSVKAGFLTLDTLNPSASNPHKVTYEATWDDKASGVLVKTQPSPDFTFLERYLCKISSLELNCDAAKAVRKNIIDLEKVLTLTSIKEIHKITGRTRSDVSVTICATEKLISVLKKMFDENADGTITSSEKAMLITTLAISPEAVALQFLTSANVNLPFPSYLGACGRAIIVDNELTPLQHYLVQPFEVRASLGAQLLQLIDDFIEDDPEWLFMFTDFTFDNLAVNGDGEVVILDVEGMVILDKAATQPLKNPKEESHGICNQQCFIQFSQQVFHSGDMEQVCQQIPQYTHLMFALVCQQILSHLDEHHVDNFFQSDHHSSNQKSESIGLLHSPPEKDRDTIEELLRECVIETAEGGRTQAAEDLHDFLNEYIGESAAQDPGDKEEFSDGDVVGE